MKWVVCLTKVPGIIRKALQYIMFKVNYQRANNDFGSLCASGSRRSSMTEGKWLQTKAKDLELNGHINNVDRSLGYRDVSCEPPLDYVYLAVCDQVCPHCGTLQSHSTSAIPQYHRCCLGSRVVLQTVALKNPGLFTDNIDQRYPTGHISTKRTQLHNPNTYLLKKNSKIDDGKIADMKSELLVTGNQRSFMRALNWITFSSVNVQMVEARQGQNRSTCLKYQTPERRYDHEIWKTCLKYQTPERRYDHKLCYIYGTYSLIKVRYLGQCENTCLESGVTKTSVGADVNLKNEGGRTALHYAASKGWVKIQLSWISRGIEGHLLQLKQKPFKVVDGSVTSAAGNPDPFYILDQVVTHFERMGQVLPHFDVSNPIHTHFENLVLDTLNLLYDPSCSEINSYVLVVDQFGHGQSNPTYLIELQSGLLVKKYVLRKKPTDQLLQSAHAVEREFQVLHALSTHTVVPVPKVFCLCTDSSVIGTPFYIMEFMEGRIFLDPMLPGVAPNRRRALYHATAKALASLHSANVDAIGLGNYGRVNNYCKRQRNPLMLKLIDWLRQNIPLEDSSGSTACLVHGDFRIDNLLFHPIEDRVIAILDWELSTLGNQMCDIAYSCMSYVADFSLGKVKHNNGLEITDTPQGAPSLEEYLTDYCAATGKPWPAAGWKFYVAFSLVRGASILAGVHPRYIMELNVPEADVERWKGHGGCILFSQLSTCQVSSAKSSPPKINGLGMRKNSQTSLQFAAECSCFTINMKVRKPLCSNHVVHGGHEEESEEIWPRKNNGDSDIIRRNLTPSGDVTANTNCGLPGHTIEKCYKIVGYPDHIKKKWANQKNSNAYTSNNASVEVPTSTSTTPPCSGTTLSAEQVQQLLSLLNSSKSSNNVHTYMGEAHHDQDSGDESPHVDGTGSSESTSLNPEATHNVDGSESLNSESRIGVVTLGKYFGPLMSDCWNQGVIAVKMETSLLFKLHPSLSLTTRNN
ncbi:Acyl-CoA dehydrogenase, N-terminal [Artemisia annua]|uniref:Acyl-CoA dehydrogenase, N-terminal n=1 Tax=Artemisia annua TaxID=35608 RepID=A0A2U1PK18_ARTAN|nr:Acyl-CoA dehydrogenase, N-terminal [Artemisia annua]